MPADAVIAGGLYSVALATFFVMMLLLVSEPRSAAIVPISAAPVPELIADHRQLAGEDDSEKLASGGPFGPLFASGFTRLAEDKDRIPDKIEEQVATPPVPVSQPPAAEPQQEPANQSSVTYVTGGGGGGGGGGGSSDEDDKPDPKPKDDDDPPKEEPPKEEPPKEEPPKEEPPSGLHGVNFIDPVLNRNEGKFKFAKQTQFVDKFVSKAKEASFNLFRIPVTWEAYVDNKANFLEELDYLVKTAKKNDVTVWIGFFQYEVTSHWPYKVSPFGGGFPKFVVSCYKPTKDYEQDPEVRKFWDDYYKNKVRDSRNSCKRTLDIWTLQADFMKVVIDKTDKHSNVLGYELLNEPDVWQDSHYDDLGVVHTELAKKLRESTDKVLIFTREIAHGKYQRNAGLEYKILPKDPAKNVLYAPHLYELKNIEEQVDVWKAVKKKWASMGYDVDIAVGEWSPQPPQLPKGKAVTQANIDAFVKVWEREGFPHTYWAFGGFRFGEGNVLVDKIGSLTRAGELYEKSILKFYN